MNKDNAKAHKAYAAHESELPSFDPQAAATLAGLMPQDTPDLEADLLVEPTQQQVPFDLVNALSDQELLAVCQPRLCVVCPVQKEADETRLRCFAELDNTKKRLNREKEDHIRFASENVLADLVPALDNLTLALQHAATDDVCKNFVVGVDMTHKLLLESLRKHGLEPVGAVGEVFDPARHEAVGLEHFADVEENHVGHLLSCGYTLHERLLRPARVMVCKKE